MTGMKQGAGENPFAEESEAEEEQSPVEADEPQDTIHSSDTDSEEPETKDSGRKKQSQSMQIPYKFRRDGVQDGRDRVPLFLHSETKRAERDALRVLEEEFDSNVSLTDLREALVMSGLNHLDEVELQLEDWGYGMTFEE